jgi:hypothetical protein
MAKGQRAIRSFEVNPADDGSEPLCFGLGGPPGGGKTFSALRIADGMSRVRGGKPALIDTEAGRARKYHVSRNPEGFDFDYIPFSPPFRPENFLDAINAALALNPSCVIVDNASDEHEGPGGVLEWRDEEVARSGGNEWAAWKEPKKSRRVLTAGVQQIKVPIIMTFRARPKTTTPAGQRNPVALGYVPIAGDELLGIMDLFCLLPPRSNGVASWSSQKAGEDFAIKLPSFLAPFIRQGAPLDEALGEALARWQLGKAAPAATGGERRRLTPAQQVDAYVEGINGCKTLDELLDYQRDERRTKWRDGIKAGDATLFDRIVEAQSRRFSELSPADEGGLAGDRESDMADGDDKFPS